MMEDIGLRGKALLAARKILEPRVYDAMMGSSIGPIRILESAGMKAFTDNLSGSYVEDLRMALRTLYEDGVLE